jgi:hypothetical protein
VVAAAVPSAAASAARYHAPTAAVTAGAKPQGRPVLSTEQGWQQRPSALTLPVTSEAFGGLPATPKTSSQSAATSPGVAAALRSLPAFSPLGAGGKSTLLGEKRLLAGTSATVQRLRSLGALPATPNREQLVHLQRGGGGGGGGGSRSTSPSPTTSPTYGGGGAGEGNDAGADDDMHVFAAIEELVSHPEGSRPRPSTSSAGNRAGAGEPGGRKSIVGGSAASARKSTAAPTIVGDENARWVANRAADELRRIQAAAVAPTYDPHAAAAAELAMRQPMFG